MKVDRLAKVASTDGVMDEQVEVQQFLSINIPEVQQVDGKANQTTSIVSYLKDRILLEDKEVAWKLRIRSTKFILMDEVLLKEFSLNPT